MSEEIKAYHILSKWEVTTGSHDSEDSKNHSNCLDGIIAAASKNVAEDGRPQYIVEIARVVKAEKSPYKVIIEDHL